MVLQFFSISSMSVSSSQGFTSKRTEVFAMRAGFLDFFSAYALSLSSVILFFSSLSSSSSLPKRSTSSSSSLLAGAAVRKRNKLAAARCRKRRVDQTDTLQGHVDEQEEKKRKLQEQIQALQSERAELEFILEAHRAVCSRINSGVAEGPRVVVKEEPEVPTSTTRHLTHAE